MGKMNKKHNLLPIFLSAALIVVSLAYFFERQKTSQLMKIIKRQDAIVAPYYDKNVFQLPESLKNLGNKRINVAIPIIMYHYVDYITDMKDLVRRRLTIVPSVFEEHLIALRKARYETYFVRDIPDIVSGNTPYYSSHSAVLTFDDGYDDFYTKVFPLLKKYHVRATVYVIYDYIGRKGFLNEKQILELAESDLVEIGSHTLDHVYLKVAPDLYAERQIVESKRKLEERFGIKVKTFAYPYGAFNSKNIETVKKAGYVAAVSVITGKSQSKENLFYLFRIRPELFSAQSMIRVIEQMTK
jgi:peptidoglycan/xylan/chitin deacetylase (PgdA/CDA1 family)